MYLPYLTKYKCGGCDKLHRLTFEQWKFSVSQVWEYVETQKKASNLETALKRAEEFKGFKFDKSNRWYQRLAKKLMDL